MAEEANTITQRIQLIVNLSLMTKIRLDLA